MSNQPAPLPPRWPLQIMRYFVRADYLEEIEGDMEDFTTEYKPDCDYASPSFPAIAKDHQTFPNYFSDQHHWPG